MVSRNPSKHCILFKAALFTVFSVFIAAGCGKSTGTISGKVYFKDQPLRGGTVAFASVDGKGGGTSLIAEDGSYTIADLLPGDYRIAVETNSLKPNQQVEMAKSKMPKENLPPGAKDDYGQKSADRYTAIPDRFSKPDTSKLMTTVNAGPQEYKIDLGNN